jgi:hypothetical protein
MVRDRGFEPLTPTVSRCSKSLGESIFPREPPPYEAMQTHVKRQSVTGKCDKFHDDLTFSCKRLDT